MGIIYEGDWNRMSAVIGICGVNFCSFLADRRLTTTYGGETKIVTDDFHKIFKINDHVLFGATGMFERIEAIVEPLGSFRKWNDLTVQAALNATVQYAEKHLYTMPLARNYLIGGKDETGRFCMHEVHINFEKCVVETHDRTPKPPTSNFGVSCCLPPRLTGRVEEYTGIVGECITSSTRHKEMLEKAAGVIGQIAEQDMTVGKQVEALTIA